MFTSYGVRKIWSLSRLDLTAESLLLLIVYVRMIRALLYRDLQQPTTCVTHSSNTPLSESELLYFWSLLLTCDIFLFISRDASLPTYSYVPIYTHTRYILICTDIYLYIPGVQYGVLWFWNLNSPLRDKNRNWRAAFRVGFVVFGWLNYCIYVHMIWYYYRRLGVQEFSSTAVEVFFFVAGDLAAVWLLLKPRWTCEPTTAAVLLATLDLPVSPRLMLFCCCFWPTTQPHLTVPYTVASEMMSARLWRFGD